MSGSPVPGSALETAFFLPDLPHGKQAAWKFRIFPAAGGVRKLALKKGPFPGIYGFDRFRREVSSCCPYTRFRRRSNSNTAPHKALCFAVGRLFSARARTHK